MKFHFLMILFLGYAFGACRRFVDIFPPQNQLVSSSVFTNDQSATASVTGLYSQMMNDLSGYGLNNGGIGICTGLSGDEFINYSTLADQIQLYENAIQPSNAYITGLWNNGYNYIYTCNAILEGLKTSKGVTDLISRNLQGEAHFIRAFCYFNLFNLFGELPIVTSTKYQLNELLSRSTRDSCNQLIVSDLREAIQLLPVDFAAYGGERTRATRFAAMAMLSRVSLYLGDWSAAKTEADSVIQQTDQFGLVEVNSVFLANSMEAILQFIPSVPEYNTWDGANFILNDDPAVSLGQVALSHALTTGFEPSDLRRTNWIDSILIGDSVYYFPFKYKVQQSDVVSEYFMVLRIGELILNRAEAEVHLNNLTGALADLNAIRTRAGVPAYSSASQTDLLNAIQMERRLELFCEWGHRWFDLKRSGHIQMTLAASKPNWQGRDSLYPIPLNELQSDHFLVQNPGY